ncbi:Zinc finger protein 862 [Frankliniella fusca]|uniref:Zinc finger protein 862 n=1 Tax=Frankliniella fusca TaxID=407009 RepID=A0AAE1I0G1_9NEOP|nr:Zinc finger protein 862 [Frankliniella fusca]
MIRGCIIDISFWTGLWAQSRQQYQERRNGEYAEPNTWEVGNRDTASPEGLPTSQVFGSALIQSLSQQSEPAVPAVGSADTWVQPKVPPSDTHHHGLVLPPDPHHHGQVLPPDPHHHGQVLPPDPHHHGQELPANPHHLQFLPNLDNLVPLLAPSDRHLHETTLDDSGKSPSTSRVQRYRKAWERDFKWLAPVPGDDTHASCKLCKGRMRADVSVIRRHESTSKHADWVQGQAATTSSMLQSWASEDKKNEGKITVAEMKLTAFLAAHDVPFRQIDHLIPVLKDCFKDSEVCQGMKLGRTKATGVVRTVLAAAEKDGLTDVLKKTKFSFYDEGVGRVVSRLWDLAQVFRDDNAQGAEAGATADRLHSLIMKSFDERGIPRENIIGFGSDGCNVMMGAHNSVSSRMKLELPGIFIMTCICHSLLLCASEGCKQLPRVVEDLSRNIFNIFKSSSKRKAMYRQFQTFYDLDPLQILKPAQTRWLSLRAVVDRILLQWDALSLFFDDQWLQARLEAAERVHVALHDPFNKAFYLFLQWILPKFTNLNEVFQGEKALLPVLHQKMCQAYDELLSMYLKEAYVRSRPLQELQHDREDAFKPLNQLFFGLGVQQQLDSPACMAHPPMIEQFKAKCRTFMLASCSAMRKRYEFGDQAMAQMRLVSPAVSTSSGPDQPPTMLDLARLLPRCVPPDTETLQQLEEEWRALPRLSIPAEAKPCLKEADQFWHVMLTATDECGELLLKIMHRSALNILSLPHSNAECERIFSKVNRIKTHLRNRLVVPTVLGCMVASQSVRRGGSCCTSFRPDADLKSRYTARTIYGGEAAAAEEERVVEDLEWAWDEDEVE